MKIVEQESCDESSPYSLFLFAVRSKVTRDYYLRKIRIFSNFINLEPNKKIEDVIILLEKEQKMRIGLLTA